MKLSDRIKALLNILPEEEHAPILAAIEDADEAAAAADAAGIRRKAYEEGDKMEDDQKMGDHEDRKMIDEDMAEAIRMIIREEIQRALMPMEEDADDEEVAEVMVETKAFGAVISQQVKDNADLTRALIDVNKRLAEATADKAISGEAVKALSDRVAVLEAAYGSRPRRATQDKSTEVDPESPVAKEIRARSAAETAPDFLKGLYQPEGS